jgi:type IV pilus modification protein PilV
MTNHTPEYSPKIPRMGGFSLIEALISFVIIAVGMLGLARFQGASLERNADSKARTEALNLAQARLEGLRNLRGEADFQTRLAAGTNSDSVEGGHAIFSRAWDITRDGTFDRAVVDVTVSWSDAEGISQSVNLASVVSEVRPEKSGQYYVAMVGVPGTPPTPLMVGREDHDDHD